MHFAGALWSGLIDKWHLGALRLLDFSSLAILFAVSRSWLARWLTISPLVSLGKASLEVFCVHLLFCFAALSFIGDGEVLPVWAQSIVIAPSFVGLIPWLAYPWKPAPANGPLYCRTLINSCD